MANHNLIDIYSALLSIYGKQGWWPVTNNKTLLCEYPGNTPRTEEEAFEIAISCILAQNTQWYPNVVRSLQQLKIGRPFTKEESMFIQQKELLYHKTNGSKNIKIDKANISKKQEKITKNNILTENTSWQNVEKALLKKVKCLSPKDIQEIEVEKLEQLIRSSGFFKQKSQRLKLLSKFILSFGTFEQFKKQVTREQLLNLKGIGPETADSILLYVCNKPYFVIDTYTRKLCDKVKLRVSKEKISSYGEYQRFFEHNLPKDIGLYKEFHALIVRSGKDKFKEILSKTDSYKKKVYKY